MSCNRLGHELHDAHPQKMADGDVPDGSAMSKKEKVEYVLAHADEAFIARHKICLLYTSPSPRD